jgi:hypothetical protein
MARFLLLGALLSAGAFLIGFGGWLLNKSRVPAWMKGIWKWPLGDDLTPTVARLLGWSNVLVGATSIPVGVVLGWDRSPMTWIAASIAMFLVGAGTFALVWSIFLSRSTRPRQE